MNSNPAGGLLSPDIRAYWKFAADPANAAKSVVEVQGPKISMARLEESSSTEHTQDDIRYLSTDERSCVSRTTKTEVVAHFKEALHLKYGARVSDFFTEADEQEALNKGLTHQLVQRVASRVRDYEATPLVQAFEKVKRSHQKLEQAYDKHDKLFDALERQIAFLGLAEAYLEHHACVADFKAMAREHSEDETIQNYLKDESMYFQKITLARIVSVLKNAVDLFFDMAQQSFNKIGSAGQSSALPRSGLSLAQEGALELERYDDLICKSLHLLESIPQKKGASLKEQQEAHNDLIRMDIINRKMVWMLEDTKELFDVNYRLGRWGASRGQFEKEMFLSRQKQALTPSTDSSSTATAAAVESSLPEQPSDSATAKKQTLKKVTFAPETKSLASPRKITEEELKEAHDAVFKKIDQRTSSPISRPVLRRGQQV